MKALNGFKPDLSVSAAPAHDDCAEGDTAVQQFSF